MAKRKRSRANSFNKNTDLGDSPPAGRGGGKRGAARRAERPPERVDIYGVHAVLAALANRRRRCHRLRLTADARRAFGDRLDRALGDRASLPVEQVGRDVIEARLPPGAAHQGLVLEAAPLAPAALDDVLGAAGPSVAVVLDQVTDPRNVGAILRSAALFGAAAVVVTERHAPRETGAMAKAAAGALDQVPLVRVVNLARALGQLRGAGFWCVGLDADAADTLDAVLAGHERLALVLGAEGTGLRRLTREGCDRLARIPTAPPGAGEFCADSLNVSTAAAIALYELRRPRHA